MIYFGGLDSTGGIFIRQQMEQVPGLQSLPFAGGDGLVTSTFSKTIGTSGGGPIFGTVATTDVASAPGSKAFLAQYDSTYGVANLGAYSAAGYDCANILIQAIKAALAGGAKNPSSSSDAAGAKLFRQAVINAIQGISFNGVLGPQSFDANGDTTNRVITVYKVGPNPPNVPFSTPGWNPVAAVKVS